MMRRHPLQPMAVMSRAMVALGFCLILAPSFALARDAQRRFTVEDAIGMASFAAPGGSSQATARRVISPDGASSIVVTVRGDLATGKRVASIVLIDHAEASGFIRSGAHGQFAGARQIGRWESAGSLEPVTRWRFSSDGQWILFLGADDTGGARLYRLPATGGVAQALSPAGLTVSAYDEREGRVAFFAYPAFSDETLRQAGGPGLPDMVEGPGQGLLPLLFPNELERFWGRPAELWAGPAGTPRPVLDAAGRSVRARDSRLILSPDGAQALITRQVDEVPASWETYRPLRDLPGWNFVAAGPLDEAPDSIRRPFLYSTVDLATGAITDLTGTPNEIQAGYFDLGAAWSQHGQVAALGVYPPLDPLAHSAASVMPCAIAVIGAKDHSFDCLKQAVPQDAESLPYGDRPQVVGLAFDHDGQVLTLHSASPNAPTRVSSVTYVRRAGAWSELAGGSSAAGSEPRLFVREGLDDRPVLVGRLSGGPDRVLLDPNPHLDLISMGSVVPYRWRDDDGDLWTGVLVRPPDFDPRRAYPLVLQTHGVDEGRYLVDGPSSTGFAARALAARDILVLQIQEPEKGGGTYRESPLGAVGYRAAIRQLASEGHVDPAKVGIVAWSHFGGYALQGLVDDPSTYAAATFAEAGTNSYTEYLANIDYMGSTRELIFRAQVGTKPFGDGLNTWLERSAAFQTDRICAPILWQFNNPASLAYGWDDYAALRAQGKPVDLLYIRNGDHALVKPAQRLAEQGMNVDWYDYWLNGHRDPNPLKAARYARWDTLAGQRSCRETVSDRSR
jgi:dienelactone hydrolase